MGSTGKTAVWQDFNCNKTAAIREPAEVTTVITAIITAAPTATYNHFNVNNCKIKQLMIYSTDKENSEKCSSRFFSDIFKLLL